MNFVSSSILVDRLDAEFYSEDQINNWCHLERYGYYSLQELCDGINVGYTGELTSVYSREGVPLYRVSDIDGLSLNDEETNFVPELFSNYNPQIWIKDNDIVLAAVGNTIGKVAIKTEFVPDGVCSRALMIARTDTKKVDAYFLISYLGCSFAQKALVRGVSGSAQPVLNTPLIASLPVIDVNRVAQKYIGEKVRQAERLRAWARELGASVQNDFIELIGIFDRTPSIYESITPEFLSTRLDQNHYQKHLVENTKKLLSVEHVVLGNKAYFSNLTDGDHGNPKYGNGPVYLRASEISNGLIDVGRTVYIDKDYASQISKSCWADEGDIIFSIVGTLGLTAIIDKNTRGVMSRGIAKVRSNVLPEYYVKAFFKSDYFNLQLQRHAVGSVQRGVYISALENLIIPTFDEQIMATIAEKEHLADKVTNTLSSLTLLAKLLVEDLIEGQLTESQLVSAQQALEAGDDSLDRALLERMTAEGIDGEGDPLFDDIDQLYDLLVQAKQALDTDDTMAEA